MHWHLAFQFPTSLHTNVSFTSPQLPTNMVIAQTTSSSLSVCITSQYSILVIPHLLTPKFILLPTKWEPQSYNHKEIDSANNHWGWKRILRLQMKLQPWLTFWFQPCKTLEQRLQLLYSWTPDLQNCKVIKLCFFFKDCVLLSQKVYTNLLCSNRKVTYLLGKIKETSSGTTFLRNQGKRKL